MERHKNFKMKSIISFALVLGALTLSSCKKEGCTDENATNYNSKAKKDDGSCSYPDAAQTVGKASIMLEHIWDESTGTEFELNTAYVHPTTGDTLTFTTLKYYISNFKLKKEDGTWWTHPSSYFLVDLSTPASTSLLLSDIPVGNYTEISYVMGVDSTRNVSGAQSGALSTTNGMFWSWNSGYIMAKAEGTSPQASSGSFSYHLGGFTGVNNVITQKSAVFGSPALIVNTTSNGMVHISVHPSELFTNYGSVSNGATIHMPGAGAKSLADGFFAGIQFEHIHN